MDRKSNLKAFHLETCDDATIGESPFDWANHQFTFVARKHKNANFFTYIFVLLLTGSSFRYAPAIAFLKFLHQGCPIRGLRAAWLFHVARDVIPREVVSSGRDAILS